MNTPIASTPEQREIQNLKHQLEVAKTELANLYRFTERREDNLRRQFAFYVQYGTTPWRTDAELVKICKR